MNPTADKIHFDKLREHLAQFDFSRLFVEGLGWSRPRNEKSADFNVKNENFSRRQISELGGVVVFEIQAPNGRIPDSKTRAALHKEISRLHHENLIIFVDAKRTQSLWYWGKREGMKLLPREHFFVKGQPGDLFLFFEGFAKPEQNRSAEARKALGKIKYLNGGLFLPHRIEQDNHEIRIPDKAFENILDLFQRYSWNLNDLPGGDDNEINPDVLGYIFEKYINQKAFGAYYTRPEITEYLCERTIHNLIHSEASPQTDEIQDKQKMQCFTFLSGSTLLTAMSQSNGCF